MLRTNILHPRGAATRLGNQSGMRWRELVAWVNTMPRTDPHVMAYGYTIRRLHFAQSPGTRLHDPYCAQCSTKLVAGFKGSEQDLLELYYNSLEEIQVTYASMRQRRRNRQRATAA